MLLRPPALLSGSPAFLSTRSLLLSQLHEEQQKCWCANVASLAGLGLQARVALGAPPSTHAWGLALELQTTEQLPAQQTPGGGSWASQGQEKGQ